MKVQRSSVERALEERCAKITREKDARKRFCEIAGEKRKIPYGIAVDVVDLRISTQELSEAELFWFLQICDENATEFRLSKYGLERAFTKIEIENYDKSAYNVKQAKLPLVFDMVEVAPDQWIGSVDTKTLMKLRGSQMIRYNTNIQRTLQRKMKGETEYWKISINNRAVDQISELLKNHAFIPNTLTLNIPADDYNAEFFYDSETKKFIVKKLDHFDITDGYHRFLALCRQADLDRKFNYPMELRITNFTTERGQQFIFQEDQKTMMRKADSDSMNRNRNSNLVVDRLNENPLFYLKGNIKRSEGQLNYPNLSSIIEIIWFPTKQKKDEAKRLTAVLPKQIAIYTNAFIDLNEKYLEKRWTKDEMVALLVSAQHDNMEFNQNSDEQIKTILAFLKETKFKNMRRSVRDAQNKIGGVDNV